MILISIHAPARGATSYESYGVNFYKFQSTLPRGERRRQLTPLCDECHISIHAPARGATLCKKRSIDFKPISIHAPARGATGTTGQIPAKQSISIHAPARGATQPNCSKNGTVNDFNPRSREGSDAGVMYDAMDKYISIHAPARGATLEPVRGH